MSQFEFLTVAFSVLLAVTVVRLTEGLIAELRSKRRYWVHLLWILQSLFSVAGIWWSLWGFEQLSWSYLIFLMVLGGPTLLYTQAIALVPRELENLDWKKYYYENSRFFMLVSALTSFYILELSILVESIPIQLRITMGILGAGYVVMAFIRQQRAHQIFVVSCFALALIVIVPALSYIS